MADKATVTIFDRDWPGRPLPVMPGDFSQYLLDGSGFEGDFDPVRNAPPSQPAGGLVYFDDSIAPGDLAALLRAMHVPSHEKHFVVVAGSSRKPIEDHYLDQARIISGAALFNQFWADQETRTLAAQPISVAEYIVQFVDEQRRKWKEPDRDPFPDSLDVLFGGDGDGAKEALCFGLMIESPHWPVYRVWSRAWLVSK